MLSYIESPTNQRVKLITKLLGSSKERKKQGLFVLEGLRLCFDCINNSKIEAESVFFTDEIYQKYSAQFDLISSHLPSFVISPQISTKLARTVNPQGVFLVCKIPEFKNEVNFAGKYIALDNIQNPDNFGAISRCVEAMGLSGIIIGGGVDIFNPKALRASMGSSLRLNIIKTDNLTKMLFDLKTKGMKIYSSVVDSSAAGVCDVDFCDGCVVVLGNEGNGISESVKSISSLFTIPMAGKAESLNAASAASIICWELSK